MDDQLESVRDWSSLPSNILGMLLNRLNDTETDCRRLTSVCTSWRSSIPPIYPLKFPVTVILPFPSIFSISARLIKDIDINLIFPPNLFPTSPVPASSPSLDSSPSLASSEEKDDRQSGMLRQSIFYLIHSPIESSSTSSVWLTRVQEKPLPNTYELLNPFTPVDELNHPLPELKLEVNFLDYRISEVARSYGMHGELNELMSIKTVMLPKTGATTENLRLLVIWNNKKLEAFKAGADEWVSIQTSDGNYSDIIAFEGIFYATDLKGRLISVDPMTFEVKEIIRSHSDEAQESNRLFTYLVESCGRLYLVSKIINNSVINEIKVFTLGYMYSANGECNHFWEPVMSLGDRVFFVSEYVTFSLTAQELGWGQGNRILFTEEGFLGYGYYEDEEFEYNDDDFDMFSSNCGVYFVEDGRIITRDSLPSEYTETFWPIPSWLFSNNATTS